MEPRNLLSLHRMDFQFQRGPNRGVFVTFRPTRTSAFIPAIVWDWIVAAMSTDGTVDDNIPSEAKLLLPFEEV